MRALLIGLLSIFPQFCMAADDIAVPPGFVTQAMDVTDGQIARPKDWFYTYGNTSSGVIWSLSKENPGSGPYQTGMRIQLFAGVAKNSGKSREQFAKDFLAGKRTSAKVLDDCTQQDIGDFYRQCIEVMEAVAAPNGSRTYRILYSVMWGKQMDMVVISTFGAPPELWAGLRPTIDAMARFRLIGTAFGQDKAPSAQAPVAHP